MLSETQIRRYARHILLPDVGGRGQARLLAGSVGLEVGPDRGAAVVAVAYLAAAGVGRLVIGGDPHGPVGAAERAQGILYGAADLGRPRIDALRDRVARINPDVALEAGDPATAALALTDPALVGARDVADALARGGRVAAAAIAALARTSA